MWSLSHPNLSFFKPPFHIGVGSSRSSCSDSSLKCSYLSYQTEIVLPCFHPEALIFSNDPHPGWVFFFKLVFYFFLKNVFLKKKLFIGVEGIENHVEIPSIRWFIPHTPATATQVSAGLPQGCSGSTCCLSRRASGGRGKGERDWKAATLIGCRQLKC